MYPCTSQRSGNVASGAAPGARRGRPPPPQSAGRAAPPARRSGPCQRPTRGSGSRPTRSRGQQERTGTCAQDVKKRAQRSPCTSSFETCPFFSHVPCCKKKRA
eukprot:6081318-Pleurochrysis_carterae.AAC.1